MTTFLVYFHYTWCYNIKLTKLTKFFINFRKIRVICQIFGIFMIFDKNGFIYFRIFRNLGPAGGPGRYIL